MGRASKSTHFLCIWGSRSLTNVASARATSPRAHIAPAIQALRPKQWIKNGFVLAPLVFAGQLIHGSDLARGMWAFAIFCMASSAGYLFNDLLDVETDRHHSQKRFRPIASRRLPTGEAKLIASALGGSALLGSLLLGRSFVAMTAGYLVLTTVYSVSLKHLVGLDILAIAAAFVLRAAAGAAAIDVPISPWLYILTVIVALFMIGGKRRSEAEGPHMDESRRASSTPSYKPQALDWLMNTAVWAGVVAYSLYTLLARSLPSDHSMVLTIPFVGFGLLRNMYLVRVRHLGGAPEDTLLRDGPLLVDLCAWLAVTLLILYVIR